MRRSAGVPSNGRAWWRTITDGLYKLQTIAKSDLLPGELDFVRLARFQPSAQIAERSIALRNRRGGT